MIQTAVVCLVINEPERVHITPFFISLYCAAVAASIKLEALIFAHKTAARSAAVLLQTCAPSKYIVGECHQIGSKK